MTSSAPGAGALVCWNCGQTLPAGSQRCLYCGVPQEARSAPLVVAPDAVVEATVRHADLRAAGAPGWAPAAIAPAVSSGPASPLGDAFAGRPASVGARLVALLVDVVVVAAVGVAVALLLRSPLLTTLSVVELVAGLVVLQARTGVGPGNLLLRIRVAQADRPWSPGLGRSVVRSLVTAGGALVAGLGAWFIELSAAFDGTGRRRSWGDLAARTVVVAVPRRSDRSAAPVPLVIAPTATAAHAAPAAAPVAAPLVVAAPTAAAVPTPVPAPAAAPTPAAVPDDAAGYGDAVLAFDTAQRERLAIPAVVVLGRNPAATEATDVLIAVRDPESTVSKNHVRLELTRAGTWATDLDSTNGTDLLDEAGSATPLPAGVRTPVEDGARVRVGNRVFTISTLLEEVR